VGLHGVVAAPSAAGMGLDRDVTFEQWDRAVATVEGETTERYLVLYDVDDDLRGDALWCVRASRRASWSINRHALSDRTLECGHSQSPARSQSRLRPRSDRHGAATGWTG